MSGAFPFVGTTLTDRTDIDKSLLDLLSKINDLATNTTSVVPDNVTAPSTTGASGPWSVSCTQPTFASGQTPTPSWQAISSTGIVLRSGTGLTGNILVSEWNAGGRVTFTWGTSDQGSTKAPRYASTTLTDKKVPDKALLDLLSKINNVSSKLTFANIPPQYSSTTLTDDATTDKALLDLLTKLNKVAAVPAPIGQRTGIPYTFTPTSAPQTVSITVDFDTNGANTGTYGLSYEVFTSNIRLTSLSSPPIAGVAVGGTGYGGLTFNYSGGGSTVVPGFADPGTIIPTSGTRTLWHTYNQSPTLTANKTVLSDPYTNQSAVGVDYTYVDGGIF